MNEIKIFENKDFGKIEVLELNGEWRFEIMWSQSHWL